MKTEKRALAISIGLLWFVAFCGAVDFLTYFWEGKFWAAFFYLAAAYLFLMMTAENLMEYRRMTG